jgi:hypothetical protein
MKMDEIEHVTDGSQCWCNPTIDKGPQERAMAKFRKKPIVIEAEQFFPEKKPWPSGVFQIWHLHYIETLEGRMMVDRGDWIITGVKGERYPCKPDIFEMTYDPE